MTALLATGLTTSLKACRLLLATLALVGLAALAQPASAQQPNAPQPNSVNPTASSVKEDQLLQQMRIIHGRGTIPDAKSYNLEQPAGRDWRRFHEATLPCIPPTPLHPILTPPSLFYL